MWAASRMVVMVSGRRRNSSSLNQSGCLQLITR
jgi:hypothetical protein